MVKKVLILGSTGSIGEQAIEVARASDALEIVGLSAATSWERLAEQARELGVAAVASSDPASAARTASALDGGAIRVGAGEEGVRELISLTEPDLVLNAIVGSAGLGPTVAALSAGVDVALANKESLVVGGELVTILSEATGAQLLPVDSEHSALAQLVGAERAGTVERLVLTASGGPFRGRTDLSDVSVADALAHPTWKMGGRITVDCATLMNKGFEVIEAHHLFGLGYERVEVVVHPQSIVHALVDLIDGSTLAHLGHPDMRVPISHALHHPERAGLEMERLDLALANKESLVVGGDLVTILAEATGARILPVDSEHSALFQLLAGHEPGAVDKLVLTASGGPFRGRSDLSDVTPAEALAHPTWDMGGRITVDSATLMNKGLEVIEAHHLFGVPYSRIDVVVHPQSIVHALVELADGASLAHLGTPDMRVPISFALHHPRRVDVAAPVNLAEVGELSFEAPDFETFRCLGLAREAGATGGSAPCVLNAADEVAVEAFLGGRIPFTAIPVVIAEALGTIEPQPFAHFEEVYECDARARALAAELVERQRAAA